ncbi:helix-turn-helix domain-containing protein [Clostridium perfringens]|uniref:helix-turn-helix domain-containing protein n=1 Tax=Clostridium perfringens TaxID=1502 RepID=UPI001ABACE69|nr:LexA family transcriptional regulator [Clostridium perfringens]MBO3304589.1 helix-turn-helix domain-containing protein [Clostridium perfringens]MBO3307900.1 helix-turn-helix domain-containing protein [Clostridium perfringens]MBO3311237.1 helix-turn-helix domain-containing protein [Clostridium perfringens]MBO3317586.1 helix-turn-helix domain-containing protein [Clostridium perfringens]MBO3392702.1 helix-turn-helix domain-containing protein [Clostridium perfringens]
MNKLGIYTLASRLQEFREKNNLKQSELAEKLGISRSALSHYETGKSEPPVYILIKMAQALNCSTDYLLGFENSHNTDKNKKNDIDISSKSYYLNNLIKKNNRTFEELSLAKRRSDRMIEELNLSMRRIERIIADLELSKRRAARTIEDLSMSQKRNSLIYEDLRRSIIRNNESKILLDELTENSTYNLKENINEEYAEELIPEIENTIDLEQNYEKEESFLEKYLSELTENKNLSQKFIPVNVVGSVKCGSPAYAYSEVSSTIALPAKYKDCYLLRADGDSMNKLFLDGELIVCCQNKIPHNNDIVVAYIPEHEEATCKKLKREQQALELHPCSTIAYEIQRYDENSDVQIMAVVLGSLSDILKKENIDINKLEKELKDYS